MKKWKPYLKKPKKYQEWILSNFFHKMDIFSFFYIKFGHFIVIKLFFDVIKRESLTKKIWKQIKIKFGRIIFKNQSILLNFLTAAGCTKRGFYTPLPKIKWSGKKANKVLSKRRFYCIAILTTILVNFFSWNEYLFRFLLLRLAIS
jgi:hypothetical protein